MFEIKVLFVAIKTNFA